MDRQLLGAWRWCLCLLMLMVQPSPSSFMRVSSQHPPGLLQPVQGTWRYPSSPGGLAVLAVLAV